MSKFGFALLFLLGLLMALKPLWMWKAEKFFKLKDGENEPCRRRGDQCGIFCGYGSFIFLIQRTEEDRVCLKTVFCKVQSIR